MVSELEEAAEITHELIKEDVFYQKDNEKSEWISWVALLTMIMALISALGALLAGVTSNQLLITRTEAILELSHMESDRINFEILKSKHDILHVLNHPVDEAERTLVRNYQNHFGKLKKESVTDESQVQTTLLNHELFAIGVTLLSIAITLSGMSLVTNRKRIWVGSIVFGVIGASIVGFGVYRMLWY